jgi:hypothetical protein
MRERKYGYCILNRENRNWRAVSTAGRTGEQEKVKFSITRDKQNMYNNLISIGRTEGKGAASTVQRNRNKKATCMGRYIAGLTKVQTLQHAKMVKTAT